MDSQQLAAESRSSDSDNTTCTRLEPPSSGGSDRAISKSRAHGQFYVDTTLALPWSGHNDEAWQLANPEPVPTWVRLNAQEMALLREHWADQNSASLAIQASGSRRRPYTPPGRYADEAEEFQSSSSDGDSPIRANQSKRLRHPSPRPETRFAIEQTAVAGPCINTWRVPPLKPRRKRKEPSESSPPEHIEHRHSSQPKHRGQLIGQDREETALTRQIKACVRCRMQKNRCEPDPIFPTQRPCLRCQRLCRPALAVLPCLRYIITDARLYREQAAPCQVFSKRWQSMEIVDIQDWADNEIKTIEICHLFNYSSMKAKVRRFIPTEGDMIQEFWTDRNGTLQTHDIPPYAIADMQAHVEVVREFVERNVAEYIIALVDRADPLLWTTYMQAFRHMANAREEKEQRLMTNAFRFWACCRSTSHEGRLVGEETLGIRIVSDPSSPYHTHIPPPPIYGAQEECIYYTKLLRPLSKNILDDLQSFMLGNKKKHWLTIYLTTFILLHSCSMITRRDAETAAKWSLAHEYCNPEAIAAHHMGALTILAHFHYSNKGKKPFALALDSKRGLDEVAAAAELIPEEVFFVHESAKLIQRREPLMRQVREQKAFGHDLYWVSQLYDNEWEPSASFVI